MNINSIQGYNQRKRSAVQFTGYLSPALQKTVDRAYSEILARRDAQKAAEAATKKQVMDFFIWIGKKLRII